MKDDQGRYCYTSHICDLLNAGEKGNINGKNELEAQKDSKLGKQYYEEDMLLLKEGGTHKCYSEVKTENGNLYYEINKSAV